MLIQIVNSYFVFEFQILLTWGADPFMRGTLADSLKGHLQFSYFEVNRLFYVHFSFTHFDLFSSQISRAYALLMWQDDGAIPLFSNASLNALPLPLPLPLSLPLLSLFYTLHFFVLTVKAALPFIILEDGGGQRRFSISLIFLKRF